MALDAATAREMIKKLADDQTQYLNPLDRAHVIQALAAVSTSKPAPRLTFEGNGLSAEDDEPSVEDKESLCVSQHLLSQRHNEDGFRKHLEEHDWTDASKAILHELLEKLHVVKKQNIFLTAPRDLNDRSHFSHYSIFDVGSDGAPLPVISDKPLGTRASEIWYRTRYINVDPKKEKKAVGRDTVVREPSPLLFAALHYTQKDHFDVDELFRLLVDEKTEALPHRPFSGIPIHGRTFIWTMKYFTIIGEECIPMRWQLADERLDERDNYISISRCASVIALSLEGEPVAQITNEARRPQDRIYGDIYDPFSPWYVLGILAYPDWKSSIDCYNTTKCYVNGPEAFLVTLRAELKDARKRLLDVYECISDLVTIPPDFMFRQEVRDKLLLGDDEFKYLRRYFWAYHSLGIMNEDIQKIVNTYRTTFTEDMWKGSDKIIWPGDETLPLRYAYWRKRMAVIKADIELEINGLEDIEERSRKKMKEVSILRENLISGTSVLKQAVTVQQGHNIRLLTLVTIFFLPLTFVTSVFSMTNIKTDSFIPFGITTLAICLPTYMLIGYFITSSGLGFRSEKTRYFFNRIGYILDLLSFSIIRKLAFDHSPARSSRSPPAPAPDTER